MFIHGFLSSVEFKNQSLKYKSLVNCCDLIKPMLMLVCFSLFHYKVWFQYCCVLMIMLLILGDSQDGIFICFCEFMISYELETCKFGCSWCIIWWIHLCLRCPCKVFDKMPKKLEIMQYSKIVTKWRIHDMSLRSDDFYVVNVPCKCCWNTHELFLWDYAMFTCKSYLWTRCMITCNPHELLCY